MSNDKRNRGRGWRRKQRNRKVSNRNARTKKFKAGDAVPIKKGKLAKLNGIPCYRGQFETVYTKKWKHMYTRSAKLARARQLGFEYPRKHWSWWDVLEEYDG